MTKVYLSAAAASGAACIPFYSDHAQTQASLTPDPSLTTYSGNSMRFYNARVQHDEGGYFIEVEDAFVSAFASIAA